MSSPAAAVPAALPAHASKAALVLGALGVVFGDIGTSPLYALKECFAPGHGIAPSASNVHGILSLLFWTMTIVVSLKYVMFVLRADNHGEGGILSLVALAVRGVEDSRKRWGIMILGVFGAAMFYGDAMITPAISVLSAVEGLEVATPVFSRAVIPVTLAILTVLFVIQYHGTHRVGSLFGPVIVAWFVALATAGLYRIVDNPSVLVALDPLQAAEFITANPVAGFLVLGSVFLVITGGEALYADMGHFGARPIRLAWFGLVMPALLLNYFGQGAYVLANPDAIKNPFYLMLPAWAILPMVALATAATVIASQAVISGAYSLTRQAIQLGYIPRMRIEHTSARTMGQIYLPFVNWALFLAVVLLVLGFQSSSALAGAYGIAVASTMVITTVLMIVVSRRLWGWSRTAALALFGAFAIVDLAFLVANGFKILDGGWFPLLVGGALFSLLVTWRRGRILLHRRLAEQGIPLEPFLESLAISPPQRVEGNAVFMTGSAATVPSALLHNLKHNKVLHERVMFLTIVAHDVPYVPIEDRVQLKDLGNGFWAAEAWYGFKEQPDVPNILEACRARYGLAFEPMETSFFLSRETIVCAGERPGMATWRDHVFSWMSRNATRATDFFNIPINRVVELGTHVDI
jgi:KUP system potassium uptake protein